jgi:Fe-S oxidoreductase
LNGLKPELIVTTCQHCLHTLKNEYPQLGGSYAVKHHSEFIDELIQAGKLTLQGGASGANAYHDPCYLGRHNGVFDAPRRVIESAGGKLSEPARNRSNSFCCGAGGAQFWKEEEPGRERVPVNRYRELKETGAKTVATGCPFCMRMFTEEAAKEEEGAAPAILDIAEIVANNLRR